MFVVPENQLEKILMGEFKEMLNPKIESVLFMSFQYDHMLF